MRSVVLLVEEGRRVVATLWVKRKKRREREKEKEGQIQDQQKRREREREILIWENLKLGRLNQKGSTRRRRCTITGTLYPFYREQYLPP